MLTLNDTTNANLSHEVAAADGGVEPAREDSVLVSDITGARKSKGAHTGNPSG